MTAEFNDVHKARLFGVDDVLATEEYSHALRGRLNVGQGEERHGAEAKGKRGVMQCTRSIRVEFISMLKRA